jgi:uncharacterized protein YprB with RNaseH-like and TPR domain
MYCINESYQEDFYESNIYRFYFGDLNIGVIDIETTGLSPDRSQCILGGIVLPEEHGKRAYQFLAESKEEEEEVLRTYFQKWKDLDVVVSYNGDHFDLPFLSRRARYNRIPREELPIFLSMDLYRILDHHSPLRKMLPNLKQKTVETFLGLWSDRTDEISGGESVELYYRYVRTGDPLIRDTILLHNRDDLLQLSRLIKVFDKLDLHKIAFHTGFAVSSGEKRAYIKKLALQKNILTVSGVHKNTSLDYRIYHESHEALFSAKRKDFSLRVPLKNMNGYFCVDLEDFPFQLGDLEKHPGYQSGYLLISSQDEVNYGETNHLAKLILSEILKEL